MAEPAQKPVDDMDIEELDALMGNMEVGPPPPFSPDYKGEEPTPDEEAPEPPAEPESPPETPAEEPSPSEEPPAEPEPSEEQLAAEEARLRYEKIQADLEAQKAHNSRLAGEIGFLRQRLQSPPPPSEPYQPETQAEVDRLAQLERKLADFQAHSSQEAVQRAVVETLAQFDALPEAESLKEEVEAVAPAYAEQYRDALSVSDPQIARQLAAAIRSGIAADAKMMRIEKQRAALLERRAATVADNVKAKKAASISASGASPSPKPKPKTPQDMTPEEADAWLRRNVR